MEFGDLVTASDNKIRIYLDADERVWLCNFRGEVTDANPASVTKYNGPWHLPKEHQALPLLSKLREAQHNKMISHPAACAILVSTLRDMNAAPEIREHKQRRTNAERQAAYRTRKRVETKIPQLPNHDGVD